MRAIAAVARDCGAALLVDGAHAAGMLPVDIPSLGVDFWVGNLHKWPCAPAGTAVLWVAPRWRDRVQSLVVSGNESLGFPRSFDRVGTNDQSAWIAAPHSLRLLGSLGWDRVRAHNEALALRGQATVADVLGVPDDELRHDSGVSMAVVPLPPGIGDTRKKAQALQDHLVKLGVEAQLPMRAGRGTARLSAHLYNCPADYERLAIGIRELM